MAKKTYFLPPAMPPMPGIMIEPFVDAGGDWLTHSHPDIREAILAAAKAVVKRTGYPAMTDAQKRLERGLKWVARLGDIDPPEDGMMPTDAQALAIAVLRGDESAAAALADEVASRYATGDGWVSRDTLRGLVLRCREELVQWHAADWGIAGIRFSDMIDATANLVREVDARMPPVPMDAYNGWRRDPLVEPNIPVYGRVARSTGFISVRELPPCRRCGSPPSECLCDDGYQEDTRIIESHKPEPGAVFAVGDGVRLDCGFLRHWSSLADGSLMGIVIDTQPDGTVRVDVIPF